MSDLRKRIEGRQVFVHPHGPEAVTALEDRWGPIAREFDVLVEQRLRIQENWELTQLGRQKAHERLGERAAETAGRKLVAIDGELQRELAELYDAESLAARGLIPVAGGGFVRAEAAPEPSVKDLLLQREVRDRLQADAGRLDNRYLLAVADGSDPLFVSAIENAPKVSQLVSDDTLATAREIRVRRSPWAVSIAAQRALYDANLLLLELAQAELYSLFPAVRFGERPPRRTEAPALPITVAKLLKAS